jgi:hypothetical protein
MMIPHWLTVLGAAVVLLGFIGFAFRQGMRVTPDKDNPDNWTNSGGGGSTGDGGSSDGWGGHT